MALFFAFTNAQSIETNLIKSDKSLVVCLVYANDLGKKNYLTFSPGDWIIRDDKDNGNLDWYVNDKFVRAFYPLTQEEPMPAQPQTQDPFEPMRQVIDLDSYEYLNETYPFYIQAIEHALTAGKAPVEIGRFVVENTSSRRDIGLLCEQAARHIQRRQKA